VLAAYLVFGERLWMAILRLGLSVTEDTLLEAPLANMHEGRKPSDRARTTAPGAPASIFGRAHQPKYVIVVYG
jgi:hypothetical protein